MTSMLIAGIFECSALLMAIAGAVWANELIRRYQVTDQAFGWIFFLKEWVLWEKGQA